MAVRDIGSLLVGLLLLFHTWGVWAAVVVNMEDRVEVVKGEMAQITCMFTSDDGIGGMTLKWYYLARSGEKREIFHQDPTVKTITRDTPFTNRISVNVTVATGTVVLTINDVQLQDELDFICSIDSLTDGRDEGRTKLKVFKTPDFPTIEAAQLKHLVTDENLSKIGTCEVKNGFPKPNVTWYRNNTPLLISENVKVVYSTTSESSQLISVSSDLLKKVVKEDKDAEFYCEVKYFVPGAIEMMETQRINITVLYPSTTVNMWVQSPQGQIKEGDSVRIQCIGNGNIPATVKIETPQGISKEGSVLELDNVIRQNSGVYVCSSEDMEVFHEATGNMTLTVNYLDSAVVMPKDDVVMNQTDDLEATCNALSSLKTNTIWFKNGEVVAQGHILKLEAITFNASGTYTCVVTVPEIEGMKTTGTLRVNVNSAPEIVMPRKTEMREESLETTVELTCLARGFPPPSITWSTSDGKMLLTATSEETEHGVKSVVTVKVTSDITAFCNSVNEHGEESATFVITATSHTTQAKTTTTTTTTPTTTTTTTSSTSLASATAETPSKKVRKEGSGVIIAVIIICILLLAVLGSVLYFLYKKGKICGRSGKQDLTKEKSNKDNIVVEMKSDNTEEAILLGVNGEKQLPSDQSDEYLDVQK